MKNLKVLLINNYETPYRNELFRRLIQEPTEHTLHTLYATAPEGRRTKALGWKTSAEWDTANDAAFALPGHPHRVIIPVHTLGRLVRERPVILVCAFSRDMVLVQLLCVMFAAWHSRTRLVFWVGDTTSETAKGMARTVIDWFRRRLIKNAHGLIYYSRFSRAWALADRTLHEPKTVWIGCQTRAALTKGPLPPPRSRRPYLRILFVGGNDERKGLAQLTKDLLEATAYSGLPPVHLVTVGSASLPRINRPHFIVSRWPHIPHDRMARMYNQIDVAVIASKQEPWGFVFNEAIGCNRPCIVSSHAGAATVATDYGLTYEPGVPGSLISALNAALRLTPLQLNELRGRLSIDQSARSFGHFVQALAAGERLSIEDY